MQIKEIQLVDLTKKISPKKEKINYSDKIREILSLATLNLLSIQYKDGYWWFSLQANESIGAQFIFLQRFLKVKDEETEQGICQRILDVQRSDGSWSLYYDGPVDLSATVECYLALKIAGYDINSLPLKKAREIILKHGGLTKCTVFTKIHLAMFGLIPWSACPEMPPELILAPNWFPINIYEFSSWARACIVPLLVFMSVKPVQRITEEFNLEELFAEPHEKRDFSFKDKKGLFSWGTFFILMDKILKVYNKIPFKPFRTKATKKCLNWTWEHIQRTADIYPALAYAALGFKAMGYASDSKEIKTALNALKSFHQTYPTIDVPATCYDVQDMRSGINLQGIIKKRTKGNNPIHQQCCISPVWDTPWAILSLLEAGVSPDNPSILKSGRWLISKQITDFKGDWAVKNPKAESGGWAFEFKNDYFPDVDDTIEVVTVLERISLRDSEKANAIRKGMSWLLSMQNNDGGWGAFDKNQNCKLVNEIPFSDHRACLDPSSPDITGRMIELLARKGMTMNDQLVKKAIRYLKTSHEKFGGWYGRWGVNYIYGTWCVLTGLSELSWNPLGDEVKKATAWIKSIQNDDGGFSESPESYKCNTYVKGKQSEPSQTAWALMALVAGGEANSDSARKAAEFLLNKFNHLNHSWDELAYTGTGFPGHFYIRYHGYRYFFPILALARYYNEV